MNLKKPIEAGAYYEDELGSIGRAESVVKPFDVKGDVDCDDVLFKISGNLYTSSGLGWFNSAPRLTRRAWITHTDPAEVVAELRRRLTGLYSVAFADGLGTAADLVAEKLVDNK